MALSEEERRALEEIEKSLFAEDPSFVHSVAREHGGLQSSSSIQINAQSLAVMMLGLCALVGGIILAQNSLWFVVMAAVGFFVMFMGGLLSFMDFSRGSTEGSSSRKKKTQKVGGTVGSSTSHNKKGSMNDRLEESFRKRFEP